MKKFNLGLAMAGAPVQTGSGKKVRILCTNAKDPYYPIVALVSEGDLEQVKTFSKEGRLTFDEENPIGDLFMAPEHHVGWVNLYRSHDSVFTSGNIYATEKDATNNVLGKGCRYVTTVKIEWEE